VARQGRSKSDPAKYATTESSFDPLYGSETVLAGGDARRKIPGDGSPRWRYGTGRKL